jgi:hypothetical protein
MAESTEPRALTAALAAPAFVTRGGGAAMHAANRHVERWAPENSASRHGSLRNLGFVDRLVSPWLQTAQRSASMRMFSQMRQGFAEREGAPVSWVFPRPWYQDELDWMAAARKVTPTSPARQAPALLTTRGTFVAPHAMPAELYEYVAPSLSVARGDQPASDERVYSPLVPFAAAQAAHSMARGVAPLVGDAGAQRMSPGLRAVLSTMLERAATMRSAPAADTRIASRAPELETPPAPRPEPQISTRVAEDLAVQRVRVAELQRVARVLAERELAARVAAPSPVVAPEPAQQPRPQVSDAAAIASEQQRVEQRIAERLAERSAQAAQVERQRREVEERVAQTTRAQATARLHEQAREAAVRDARAAAIAAPPVEARARAEEPIAPAPASIHPEIASALAALPPEMAAYVGRRPERAVHAIHELGDALRGVELLARNAASGGTFESARGPRLAMPAGLGGLVAMVDRAQPVTAPTITQPQVRAPRVPATFVAPGAARGALPSALGATAATTPAAIQHVAWADRWLARFAGARPQSLDALTLASATPEHRLAALAAAAPDSVFVSPAPEATGYGLRATGSEPLERSAPRATEARELRKIDTSVMRIADDAETPDEMFFAIAAAAGKSRISSSPDARRPTPDAPAESAGVTRETLADILAQTAPGAPGAGMAAQLASSPYAPALRHLLPLAAAPSFDVRALFGGGLASAFLAGLIAPDSHEIASIAQLPHWSDAGAAAPVEATREVADWDAAYVAPDVPRDREELAPLTTLRSALLSFEVEQRSPGAAIETRAMTETQSPHVLARSLVEAMALPMMGDAALGQPLVAPGGAPERAGAAFAAPGMIADRAQAWSVAQERSSADLAFDFVPPELVLAARVYGLGPAEAAQAARLAVAGPGQLAAMAGAIDRTFVQAMAIEQQRATGYGLRAAGPEAAKPSLARPFATVYPTEGGEVAGAMGQQTFAPSATAFGVERRAPRGAFLWPSAAVAALGMTAPAPDGDHSMSVAALELLAAQSVAELGTYAALGETGTGTGTGTEDEVLEHVGGMVPAARKAKFEALYLALGQSERSWTPATRAARAFALAGRGEDTVSARERASMAWDVLPAVYAGDSHDDAPVSTGEAASRALQRREALRDAGFLEMRPGLGRLSARAGEALGSYVAPASAPAAPAASTRDTGAVLRAPTAAQELVQTGRS